MRSIKRWLINHPILYAKKFTSRRDISHYAKKGGLLRLNLGAQINRADGWLNVDIEPGVRGVYLDATNMAAVPDDTFDAVLCEHMIEHVPALEGQAVMRSIYRVLKRGGVARFVTPDLERVASIILDPQADVRREVTIFREAFRNSEIDRRYPKLTGLDYVNIMFREWGHRYIYTRNDFDAKLKNAGFLALTETKPSEFASKIFANAQGHGRLLGDELNDINAFALEATK